MNKYIKLEDAISVCEVKLKLVNGDVIGTRHPKPEENISALLDLQTIEVVYCVECLYKDSELCPMYKLKKAGVLKPYDFCSYGDGREE